MHYTLAHIPSHPVSIRVHKSGHASRLAIFDRSESCGRGESSHAEYASSSMQFATPIICSRESHRTAICRRDFEGCL